MIEFVPIKPEINQLILIEEADDIIDELEGGIVVPDTLHNRTIGKVVVPPEGSQYNAGNYILYVPNAGGIIRIRGKQYIYLYVSEIICKLQVKEKNE